MPGGMTMAQPALLHYVSGANVHRWVAGLEVVRLPLIELCPDRHNLKETITEELARASEAFSSAVLAALAEPLQGTAGVRASLRFLWDGGSLAVALLLSCDTVGDQGGPAAVGMLLDTLAAAAPDEFPVQAITDQERLAQFSGREIECEAAAQVVKAEQWLQTAAGQVYVCGRIGAAAKLDYAGVLRVMRRSPAPVLLAVTLGYGRLPEEHTAKIADYCRQLSQVAHGQMERASGRVLGVHDPLIDRVLRHYQQALEMMTRAYEVSVSVLGSRAGVRSVAQQIAGCLNGHGNEGCEGWEMDRPLLGVSVRWHTAAETPQLRASAACLNTWHAGGDSTAPRELAGLARFFTAAEAMAVFSLPALEEPVADVPLLPHFAMREQSGGGQGYPIGARAPFAAGSAGREFTVSADDLGRHVLVTGCTGAGKTNTCMLLLTAVRHSGLPFLVIEPAKAEYRRLLGVPLFSDMQVYTAGAPASPLGLSPFKVTPGFPVQTHIDYLKSAFMNSISMWEPLPSLLQRALQELYLDFGYDPAGLAEDAQSPPTMTDLVWKVEELIPRLEYEQRVKGDILEALRVRLGSMCIGAKAAVFDNRDGLLVADLLDRPVLIEMKWLGDDAEKSFLLAVLMLQLYEAVEVAAAQEPSFGVRHVTVIEEAHRVLRNVPMVSGGGLQTAGDPRAQSAEVFANLLAEVRAMGEGLVIAEQIPSKLVPDAIKNTSLKILHRLPAADDREAVGSAMGLGPDEIHYCAQLSIGEAFAGSDTIEPGLVRLHRCEDHWGVVPTAPSDAELQAVAGASGIGTSSPYPSEACKLCEARCRYGKVVGQFVSGSAEVRRRFEEALAQAQPIGALADTCWDLAAQVPAPGASRRAVAYCLLSHAVSKSKVALVFGRVGLKELKAKAATA